MGMRVVSRIAQLKSLLLVSRLFTQIRYETIGRPEATFHSYCRYAVQLAEYRVSSIVC